MVLEDLGKRINGAFSNLSKGGDIEEALDAMLKEVCAALLESDVNIKLVSQLRQKVKNSIKDVPSGASKKKVIQKSLFDELCKLVDGNEQQEGKSQTFKPVKGKSNTVMFVGLQGSGKTTSCTKLAVYYQRRGFKVGLVCADTFRAGAFDQLKQNATKAKIPFFGSYTETDPVAVAAEGVAKFKKEKFEVIIVDTSGRHRQESELFTEMVEIGEAVKPDATIMVLDASIGQAAETQSRAFKDASDFGSIILTKMDGHAKGGGAISAVAATKTPIVFIGTGEHIHDLEAFSPKQFISKLLGIGDLQGLMETMQSLNLDQKNTMAHLQEGIFTLRDLRDQMGNMLKMGSLSSIAGMIPGLSNMASSISDEEGTRRIKRMIYILDSMNGRELDSDGMVFKEQPSRVTRVARGSGTSIREVEEVLQQQKMMSSMASRMGGKNGMMSRMQQAQQNPGQMASAQRRAQQMMGGMGGMPGMGAGGGGMPGMGGMGMPDMSALQGMFPGGMPDMGQMMNMVQNNPQMKAMARSMGLGI